MMRSIVACRQNWKRVLRLSLVSILTFSLSFTPRYASADDRDDLKAMSEEIARQLAESAFYQFIVQSMMDLAPWTNIVRDLQTAELSWSTAIATDDFPALEQIRKDVNGMAVEFERVKDLIDSNQLQSKTIQEALDNYLRAYQNSIVESQVLADRIDDDLALSKMAGQFVQQVISDVDQICSKGVAISFSAPNLVPHKYSSAASQISIMVTVKRTYGDEKSETNADMSGPPNDKVYGLQLFPIGSFIDEKHGAEWSAGLTYLTLTGTYVALGGSMTAPLVATTAMYSMGITLVIAAVMLVITEGMVRNKSRDEADKVQDVFFNRANANTVAKYVKAICLQSEADIKGVPMLAKAIRDGGPNSPAAKNYRIRRENANQVIKKLMDLSKAAAAKQQELAKTTPGDEQALQNIPEVKAFNDFVKSLSGKGLLELLLVQLTDLSLATSTSTEQLADLRKTIVESKDGVLQTFHARESTLQERRDRLYAWNRLAKLSDQDENLVAALVNESAGFKEISEFGKTWQHHYFEVVKNYLATGKKGADTSDLQKDLRQVLVLEGRYGSSIFLSLIQKRSDSLLQMVGAAQ